MGNVLHSSLTGANLHDPKPHDNTFHTGVSTDGTMAANSDALVPTQKAVKSYITLIGPGMSGYSGATGAQGVQGAQGNTGSNGTSGFSGYSGHSGYSGYSGVGITGSSGYSGYSGIAPAMSLGAWTSLSLGVDYLAATDGFIVAFTTASITIYTDGNVSPTTIRASAYTTSTANSAMCPVKKDDYYRIDGSSATVYWISLA